MTEDALSAKTLALAAMLMYQSRSLEAPDTDWHTPAPYRYSFKLACDEKEYTIALVKRKDHFTVSVLDQEIVLRWVQGGGNTLIYSERGVRRHAPYTFYEDKLYLDDRGGHFIFEDRTWKIAATAGSVASGDVHSGMNGVVVEVMVSEEEEVEAGQTLVMLEAMKMQHQILAPCSGKVESVMVSAGDQVQPRQLLVKMTSEKTEGEGV